MPSRKTRKDFATQKEYLQHKQDILKNRIADLERKESNQKKKKDTRLKIVIGGAVLALLKEEEGHQKTLKEVLEYINRTAQEKDKDLFSDDSNYR